MLISLLLIWKHLLQYSSQYLLFLFITLTKYLPAYYYPVFIVKLQSVFSGGEYDHGINL